MFRDIGRTADTVQNAVDTTALARATHNDRMDTAGLVISALGLLGILTFVPRFRDHWDRRRHVRDVRTRMDPVWQFVEVTGASRARVLTGVRLVVFNSGKWPVRDVIVLHPPCVAGEDRDEIASGESWKLDLPLELAQDEYEQPVVLQLVDVRNRCWQWASAENELAAIPPPISPIARLIQWSARRFWPEHLHEKFIRLPKRVQRLLWGYDPEGENESCQW